MLSNTMSRQKICRRHGIAPQFYDLPDIASWDTVFSWVQIASESFQHITVTTNQCKLTVVWNLLATTTANLPWIRLIWWVEPWTSAWITYVSLWANALNFQSTILHIIKGKNPTPLSKAGVRDTSNKKTHLRAPGKLFKLKDNNKNN